MKRIVESTDAEGLVALLGERVTLFCLNYIYTGSLVGVNDTCVKLEKAAIVYETGPLNDHGWKDAQALPGHWYVQINAIESFGLLK